MQFSELTAGEDLGLCGASGLQGHIRCCGHKGVECRFQVVHPGQGRLGDLDR